MHRWLGSAGSFTTLAVLLSLAAALWAPIPAAQAQTPQDAPLDAALVRFADALGIDLLFDPSLLANHATACAEPPHAVDAGLDCLLHGTALRFRRLSTGTILIEPVSVSTARTRTSVLHGWVVDRVTAAPLPNAHVLVVDVTSGTTTDARGLFVLDTLPPGTYTLVVTHVGYRPTLRLIHLEAGPSDPLQLAMTQEPVPIAPLVVEDASAARPLSERPETWRGTALRAAGPGTADAIRGLNTLMGVRVGDALADVHLQGGESGEHQFRLDGVPVFEPVHLRGLLGGLNPFALERIAVHKAGFGASLGSQIAGVIDAEHRLGAPDGRTLDLQIDPLSANLRLHTARTEDGAPTRQFMLAGRTSLWEIHRPDTLRRVLRDWNRPDHFLQLASALSALATSPEVIAPIEPLLNTLPLTVDEPSLGFADVHAAGLWRWDRRNRLHASLYAGWNEINGNSLLFQVDPDEPLVEPTRSQDRYDWVNQTAQIQWSTVRSPALLTRLRLRGSRYRSNHAYDALEREGTTIRVLNREGINVPIRILDELEPVDDGNRIAEIALEASAVSTARRGVLLDTGLEIAFTDHRFTLAESFFQPIRHGDRSLRLSAYGEAQRRLGVGTTLTAGLRGTWLSERRALYAEPRMAVELTGSAPALGGWSARLATGLYRQMVNQFSLSSVSPSALLPATRFWLPVDATMAPPLAVHVAAEAELRPTAAWAVRTEAFYKHQPRILQIDYPALWTNLRDSTEATRQDAFLSAGRGYAYGLAARARYARDGVEATARYEYTITERTNPIFDDDTPRATPWSEPHRIEASLTAEPSEAFTALVRWRTAWGRTWAYRQAYYDYLATDPLSSPRIPPYDFSDPTVHEMPAYSQVDVSLAYSVEVRPILLQLRLDVLNLLDTDNLANYSVDPLTLERDERFLYPRMTSLALRVRW